MPDALSKRTRELPRAVPLSGSPAYRFEFFAAFGVIVAEVLYRGVSGPYFKASRVGADPIPDWELGLICFSAPVLPSAYLQKVGTPKHTPWGGAFISQFDTQLHDPYQRVAVGLATANA